MATKLCMGLPDSVFRKSGIVKRDVKLPKELNELEICVAAETPKIDD